MYILLESRVAVGNWVAAQDPVVEYTVKLQYIQDKTALLFLALKYLRNASQKQKGLCNLHSLFQSLLSRYWCSNSRNYVNRAWCQENNRRCCWTKKSRGRYFLLLSCFPFNRILKQWKIIFWKSWAKYMVLMVTVKSCTNSSRCTSKK